MTKNFGREYILKPTAKNKAANNLVYNGLCSAMTTFCAAVLGK